MAQGSENGIFVPATCIRLWRHILPSIGRLVPTLALINHLADVGHGPVGKDAMMRALGLATYLETHARRAYGAGPEAETAAAKAILTHIRKGNLKDGFPQGTCTSTAGRI